MIGCAKTAELQELLRMGHWPQAAGAELCAHVSGCRRCSQIVVVTQALSAAKLSAMRDARVELPELVWWRAQLRRRREMMQQVERPMLAQMVIVGTLVCLGLGLAFRLSGGVTAWRAWMGSGAEAVARSGEASLGLGLLIASAVTLAMMAGLAVYLTLERK